MQNDWAKLLLMIEFINNNALFSVIFSTSFFLNKDFHSHMSFELDVSEYESSCERLQTTKVENISEHMNKTLKFSQSEFNESESVKSWLSNQSNRARNTFMQTWIVEEEK